MESLAEFRLGETKTMACGMDATVIRYKDSTDIDVQFEDGTIVTNKNYSSFKQGFIGHPNILNVAYPKKNNRLGEKR